MGTSTLERTLLDTGIAHAFDIGPSITDQNWVRGGVIAPEHFDCSVHRAAHAAVSEMTVEQRVELLAVGQARYGESSDMFAAIYARLGGRNAQVAYVVLGMYIDILKYRDARENDYSEVD